MKILIIILMFSLTGFAREIGKDWKSIKPFHSTRASVEDIFGQPKTEISGYYNYDTTDALIQIAYSTGPCTNDEHGFGEFNVEIDKVLRYTVTFKNIIKLSDYAFNHNNFKKKSSGDVVNLFDYFDAENGIVIHAVEQRGIEYVGRVSFGPLKSDADKFRCKTASCDVGVQKN